MPPLPHARAHWLTPDTLAWNVEAPPEARFSLHFSPHGGLRPGARPHGSPLVGGQALRLVPHAEGLPPALLAKFPHLAGYTRLTLGALDAARAPELLRGQVAVSMTTPDGVAAYTGVQIAGVLDALYPYNGPLGVSYAEGIPTLRLWAPTARSVSLRLFDGSAGRSVTQRLFGSFTPPDGRAVPMRFDPASGVWSVTGRPDWTGRFYLYEVWVYVPATDLVEKNLVTDPYSVSLSTNSRRSQVVNLADPALRPAGWDDLQRPPLAALEDIVLYELHVRDFSASDPSVPPAHRGKFLAFTHPDSNGMRHLRALAEAGLTHVHLLPAFDFVTVNDDPAQRLEPNPAELRAAPPDSEAQQAAVAAVQDRDGFNWGYDPYHYGVPEGSYAVDPDGPARILEFRAMVQALNRAGLRVVMDVVYNHTASCGQQAHSVLDRVVPGYYYRLNADGQVETSSCCCNTATEHAMMEKLMLDTLRQWATAYKVDGFRFDLMGHHLLSNMSRVRRMLDALTLEQDGVDGQKIYVYGEGWDFGEVAHNGRGKNASQGNLAGLGIGSFNDRLRDGMRGGRPFGGLQDQGFISGLFYTPNAVDQGPPEHQRARLLHDADWIRIGLTGNLRDCTLVDADGREVKGAELDFNGSPTGYTASPRECINYISAHDNETLFDALQLKLPAAMPLADRLRLHRLGLSLVLLGQGIPFFHAGDDLLRSKSLDRNSYNSGDWFNRLDFTYTSNNWGVGLPPSRDNAEQWPVMKPLLADAALRPGRADILATAAHFREMLRVRKSSRLFRLETAEDVRAALTFQNTGPTQIPGLIALTLSGPAGLGRPWQRIAVIFNATPAEQTCADPAWAGQAWTLHPVLAASADPVVRLARCAQADGAFIVPAYTAAVFVV